MALFMRLLLATEAVVVSAIGTVYRPLGGAMARRLDREFAREPPLTFSTNIVVVV
jgi:hypothetical protein